MCDKFDNTCSTCTIATRKLLVSSLQLANRIRNQTTTQMPIFSYVFVLDRYNKLVTTVNKKCICKKLQVHKIATTNNNFEENDYFRHASSCNVHVYQFSTKSG